MHIRKKDLTYEIEQHAPDDMREMSVVSAPCGEGARGGGLTCAVLVPGVGWAGARRLGHTSGRTYGRLRGAQRVIGQ